MKKPDYVHGFVDRHGKPRFYLRRTGEKQLPLPGLPWSPEFMSAYEAAMSGEPMPSQREPRATRGTVAALTVAYFNSAEFGGLAETTQATYRGIIKAFRAEHGDKRVALLKRPHIELMLGKKIKTPAAANNWLRMVRTLMQFAIGQGLRTDDPTAGVKPIKSTSQGFHAWTEDEIATFEAHHAIGTRARLAFALLIYSAQRRGDVVRMGRQHVRNGVLSIRQQKTGAQVDIPVHPALAEIIAVTPSDHLTFLVNRYSAAFSSAGFGNWFGECCDEAGLPECCAAHGLRKAASRRLAEAGCTAHEIMAITGHKTLKEVTRYAAAADRIGLAARAMAKQTGTSSGKPQK